MNQAAAVGPVAAVPVVWSFLGFDFQAGPVVVGICAVAIVRAIVSLNSRTKPRLALDILVSLLCALVTALWVQAHTLGLLAAGVTGISFASIGLGIIGLAKSQFLGPLRAAWAAALAAALGASAPAAAPPPPPPAPADDDRDGIDDAMRALDRID